MLDDLVLSRCQGASGNLISWSTDGYISLPFRKEFFILRPKSSEDISEISDVFSLTRLGGSISELPNALDEVVCTDEEICVGQLQDSATTSVVEARWSASGVGENKQCVLSLVTDTGNAFILEQDGLNNWEVRHNVIDALKKDENIDLQRIVKYSQLRRLRVKSIGWFHHLHSSLLKAPVWPLEVSSTFVLCTEHNSAWLYRMGGSLSRLLEIQLPATKVRKCEVSDWTRNGDSLEAFVVFELVTNELLAQKIEYNKEFVAKEQFSIRPPSPVLVSQFALSTFDGRSYCTITSDILQCVQLSSGKTLSHPLSSVVSISSIIQKENFLVLSNGHKDLIFGTVDWNTNKVILYEHDYRRSIQYDHPLAAKLNEVNKVRPFRIMALSYNPTKDFIALIHAQRSQNAIDSRNISLKEDYSLAIVPVSKPATLQLSSINYSPPYIEQLCDLWPHDNLKSLKIETPSAPKLPSDLKLALSELYLSEQIQGLRLANLLQAHSLDPVLLRVLARAVVNHVSAHHPQLDDCDTLLYNNYLQFLGQPPLTSKKTVTLNIPGLNATETFALDAPFDPDAITSEQSHTWLRCSATLLPLFTTKLLVCETSGKRVISPASPHLGPLTKQVLEGLQICFFSGGRWIRR
ncbi:hypothetical protein KL942_001573 [Ogataea angusta]|uniref:Transcription factor IIIC 90kDa subunit N-terminal domain-containing protein n=1 Tax=Pichia angusta TaxID=870730 RepID=A0ABQ7S060_PICAN|nr:hypothetical protein KL942_001573 [Ogataea angusta]KAG7850728.1 hypothetical protein KL940_001305 [Ogataea angusta]